MDDKGKMAQVQLPGWFRDVVAESDGRKFLNGVGPVPCDALFIAQVPTQREVVARKPWSSQDAELSKKAMRDAGVDFGKCRLTYSVKHVPKKMTAAETKVCSRMLAEEIEACDPKIVVCLGAEPLKSVVGATYRWDDVHGAFFTPDSVPDCKFKVFATYSMSQVVPFPKWDRFFARDMRLVADAIGGKWHEPPKCDRAVVHEPEEVRSFADWLLGKPHPMICLDCEWHGKNWMDPDRYFRTIQLGYARGKVVVVELCLEGGKRCSERHDEVLAELRRLLEDSRIGIVGHNVIADGEWLLASGIDIRDRVVYDTMLAEHIIDQNGPFGLEALAMKYTPYGRYSVDVEVWVRRHKGSKLQDSTEDGYGFVPRDMLLDYAGADVDVLRYIMDKQIPILKERGCLSPRGVDGEYPSLFRTVLNTQRVTYDLERNGLPVDMAQLDMLTGKYQDARAGALANVMQLARTAGFPEFNPRSVQHLRKMLFGVLGLTPIKTTDGDDWGDVAGNMGMDSEEDVFASTDKTTLQILEGRHPFVDALLDFRRVDQVCKTWLTKEKDGKPAGLYALLWPDGTLKPRFSTLTETGRYRTQNPNCFPKEVEVLTEHGWMHWDELYNHAERDTIRLAQWNTSTREISFELPLGYVEQKPQPCVHNKTRLHVDIVSTEDHRFTLYNRKDFSKSKVGTGTTLSKQTDWVLPQAGKLVKDGVSLSDAQITLICALQADGYLVPYGGIKWGFARPRKAERLQQALDTLGIPYTRRMDASRYKGQRYETHVFYVGKNNVPDWLWDKKFFGEWLMQYDADTLARFEKEVWLWDGCANKSSMYASKEKKNSDWVQLLCLFNNRRAKIRRYVSNGGSVSWQVDASPEWYSQLANVSLEDYGSHTTYCVKMPEDTVIVRYNDRIAFTNQCQNFPKKAEGSLSKIFGNGNEPPLLRTIVDPNQRAEYRRKSLVMCQIEGDFCQAELFCMANITGDENMIRTLTTPGLDLHDKTTIDSFGFHVYDDGGREVSEDDLVALATSLKDQGGAESEEYQRYMKTLVYVNAHGERMTRAQFKSGPRVSGKAISFGVPYGRGANALALQIKSETGDPRPLEAIAAEAAKTLETWKTRLFPQCWSTIVSWKNMVYDPGYIENPWGMRKTAHLRRGERNPSLERQFGNFPIQSTVAGTVQIAMDQMRRYILENDMPFRMQNQIHDAVMIECPIDYVDECKRMFKETMAGIRIPLSGGRWFSLDIDIDVYERWGVKMK